MADIVLLFILKGRDCMSKVLIEVLVIILIAGSYGRYKNISHVAVYVGNGMVVEAKGVAYGVTYNAVPNVGSIVLIGRPQ